MIESKKKSLVISIEGGDGTGKTTILEMIEKYLEGNNRDYMVTREPGGVRIAEDIREIILNKRNIEMDGKTEALLYAAARRQHLVQKVMPAIEEGKLIIFDRYVDSSMVYQGYVRGIGIDEVYEMNRFATEDFLPDLTICLDLDPRIGMERIALNSDREVNRLDLEGIDFHYKVREGYKILAERFPDRIVMIDANQGIEKVFQRVLKEMENYL